LGRDIGLPLREYNMLKHIFLCVSVVVSNFVVPLGIKCIETFALNLGEARDRTWTSSTWICEFGRASAGSLSLPKASSVALSYDDWQPKDKLNVSMRFGLS